MFSFAKKATLATALAASALTSVSPAMARGYRHHGGGDTAAIAIGAGILGLAVGAIAASNSHRHDRNYNDRYYNNGYNSNGYYYRNGYYYDPRSRQWDRGDYRRGYGSDYYERRGY